MKKKRGRPPKTSQEQENYTKADIKLNVEVNKRQLTIAPFGKAGKKRPKKVTAQSSSGFFPSSEETNDNSQEGRKKKICHNLQSD